MSEYEQLKLFHEVVDFGICPRCGAALTGPGWFHRDPRGPICDRCRAVEWRQSEDGKVIVSEMVSVTGGVEEVGNRTVLLWLSGFDGLQETPITDEMPGWMLCSGAEFRARISEENYRRHSLDGVVWSDITPQEYTHLSENGLLDLLDTLFAYDN